MNLTPLWVKDSVSRLTDLRPRWLTRNIVRNAYTLLNWGDFVDDSSAARGSPFIQLLPLTSPVQAHQEFVKVRLNGVDTTGDPQYKLLAHGKSSPVPKGERVQHLEGFVSMLCSVHHKAQYPYIFVLSHHPRRSDISLRSWQAHLQGLPSLSVSLYVAACAEEEQRGELAGSATATKAA